MLRRALERGTSPLSVTLTQPTGVRLADHGRCQPSARMKSIMAVLTSPGLSCCVQCPHPGSRIAERSPGTVRRIRETTSLGPGWLTTKSRSPARNRAGTVTRAGQGRPGEIRPLLARPADDAMSTSIPGSHATAAPMGRRPLPRYASAARPHRPGDGGSRPGHPARRLPLPAQPPAVAQARIWPRQAGAWLDQRPAVSPRQPQTGRCQTIAKQERTVTWHFCR
jgi:hypothetical protein